MVFSHGVTADNLPDVLQQKTTLHKSSSSLVICFLVQKRIGTYSVVFPSAFAESYRTLPSVWQIRSKEDGFVSISFGC